MQLINEIVGLLCYVAKGLTRDAMVHNIGAMPLTVEGLVLLGWYC